MSNDLNRLAEDARNGDRGAENRIFQHLLVRFRLFAARRVGSKEAAEDIAQNACVVVLEKYKTESFSVGFDAWAYGVLRMAIRNYHHRLSQDKERALVEVAGGERKKAAPQRLPPEMEAQLVNCLAKVAAQNRRYARVLNFKYQGYTTEEICRRLAVSRNHLYVILNRARSKLWRCLQGESV